MARGRRHAVLLLLPALLLAQGSSCLDFLDDPVPGAVRCCVVCPEGQAPCGDACVDEGAACDEDPGCACSVAPPAGSACAAACDVEATCGFRDMATCVGQSCFVDGARAATAGDDCLTAAANCGEAAACACPGGCDKLDECTGSSDATCEGTCATLVDQEPVQTFQENRCRIESSCDDLPLCSQD